MQLNLGSEEEPEVKKRRNTRNLKIALGLVAVILIPTIGSTLAGNITIGTDNSVEFGQGFTATAACDSDGITVIPSAVLVSGTFNLESITVSGVNTGCTSKNFTFKVLNSSNAEQIIGSSSATSCRVVFVTATPSTSSSGTCIVSGSTATGFALAPASGVTLGATNVSKITLETS